MKSQSAKVLAVRPRLVLARIQRNLARARQRASHDPPALALLDKIEKDLHLFIEEMNREKQNQPVSWGNLVTWVILISKTLEMYAKQ